MIFVENLVASAIDPAPERHAGVLGVREVDLSSGGRIYGCMEKGAE